MIDCCLHKSESLTGRLEYNFKFVLEILSVEKNVANTPLTAIKKSFISSKTSQRVHNIKHARTHVAGRS
jgi:hypothetical protein